METEFFKMQKRVAKNLIKPVEYEDFWSRKSKKCSENDQKHYLEKVFATRFQNVKKPYKTNGKHGLSKCVKNPIKTMEMQFLKMQKCCRKTL